MVNDDKVAGENEEKLAGQLVNNPGKAGTVSLIAGVRSVATDTVEALLEDLVLKGLGNFLMAKGRKRNNKVHKQQLKVLLLIREDKQLIVESPVVLSLLVLFHEHSASGIAVAMTDVSQALEGEEKEAGVDKSPATLADLVEKPAAMLAIAVQAGQLLSPAKTGRVFDGKAVTAHLETADTQNSDVQAMQKSNGRDWTAVNRSPNKQNFPVSKNQFASKNVSVSNSFDVLLNKLCWVMLRRMYSRLVMIWP
ncbi:hypothetical protein A4A49_12030 [Nicotiana attenuata]|uniref:Uncharacterized protein n=1 Tax=Nicotiana attenuata TaxID=49451 RepID=A0A314LDJ1_NICAT|nr:hypothetical protein A4A49_12030 [Nicotiana attenuata]